MRSLLIQASGIDKAVEKAWTSAGMPSEFTIKILDFGEKGFLGISKKPAIVSIIYDPQKQTVREERPEPAKTPHPVQPSPIRTPEARPRRFQNQRPPERSRDVSQRPVETRNEIRPTGTQEQRSNEPEPQYWTESMSQDVNAWMSELATVMNITTPFKIQLNKKALFITFESPVLSGQEDERLLFSALSYLLVQFMKKKNKKKFQGYQLVLSSKRADNTPR
jgi:hypothetical protein